MYEMIEGFLGVEVNVDDILVCGFGDIVVNEVVEDYDKN